MQLQFWYPCCILLEISKSAGKATEEDASEGGGGLSESFKLGIATHNEHRSYWPAIARIQEVYEGYESKEAKNE